MIKEMKGEKMLKKDGKKIKKEIYGKEENLNINNFSSRSFGNIGDSSEISPSPTLGSGENEDALKKINEKREFEEKIKKWICPECNGKIINDPIHSQKYCKDCGRVYEDNPIDYGKEWRSFEGDEGKIRSGGIIEYSKQDKGLSTEIKTFASDIMGVPLPNKTKIKFVRLRKFHYRIRIGSTARKNLYLALQEIDRLCSQLDIPKNIKEDTAYIYTIATERKISKGLSIEGMVATALFMVARAHNFPLTLRAMRKISGVNTKIISNYKKILKPLIIEKFKEQKKILDADTYLQKLASKFGVPPFIVEDAEKILNVAKEKNMLAGRNPVSYVVGALYLACERNNFKIHIKELPDVGYVTVMKKVSELNKILNPELMEKLKT